jgi:hypothetical protein
MMRRRERKEKAEQNALRIRLSPCDYEHERPLALSRNGLRPRREWLQVTRSTARNPWSLGPAMIK